jgi:hypothetical protein
VADGGKPGDDGERRLGRWGIRSGPSGSSGVEVRASWFPPRGGVEWNVGARVVPTWCCTHPAGIG